MDIHIIEKQLEKIPPEIKRAFFSVETAQKIAAVGEKNGLLLDKINDLIEETGLTMIGLQPADKFVDIITAKLNLERSVAFKIATEINDTVLADIKKAAREHTEEGMSAQETPKEKEVEQDHSSLEQAGNFTIEKDTGYHAGEGAHYSTPPDELEHRDHILKHIEDPHTEPLVDHLLTQPTLVPEEKIEQSLPNQAPTHHTAEPPASLPTEPTSIVSPSSSNTPPQPSIPPKTFRSGPDPYREPTE